MRNINILEINELTQRYAFSINEKNIIPFQYKDRDNVFFCDGEGTGPTYELTPESSFVIHVEPQTVQFLRLYSGTSVDDLMVVSPEPTRGIPLTDYEQGYLNSYLIQMFLSGCIE